jgi:sugar phosphate isomerase/epimerase
VPRWSEFLQKVAPVAENHGVTVALEPCTRPGLATDTDVIALLEEADSPRVRAYLDVANIRMVGVDSVAAVRSLGAEYLAHIHMKDLAERPAGEGTGYSVVGIGEGMLDFPAICAAIVEVGYDGWLTLETPGGDEPNASARRNLEALRSLFA